VSTIVVLVWFLTRPLWTRLKSEFAWSEATGERVLEAAVVYVAVVFAGGYWIRYLTSGLIAGIEKPGESPEQIKNAGMYRLAGTILGHNCDRGSISFHGGVDPDGKVDCTISGVEGTLRGVFLDRHFAEHRTRSPRWFGFGKTLVRDDIVEVSTVVPGFASS